MGCHISFSALGTDKKKGIVPVPEPNMPDQRAVREPSQRAGAGAGHAWPESRLGKEPPERAVRRDPLGEIRWERAVGERAVGREPSERAVG
jgi:hypothetical protein